MEEGRSAFKISTGKPTGKRPLWMPMRRWEDHIRMNLEEIGINAENRVDSVQFMNRSPNIVRAIKSRGLRWTDHVARRD